jgi:AraC family ethanolamine operon transcriptional activator
VIEVCQELLRGPWGRKRPRTLRQSPGRQRLVRAVEDLFRAGPPGRAITTEDTAAALGVSAACPRRAFHATYGVGLQRYLRIRRLTVLRQALRAAAGREPQNASEFARAQGFSNLDRLARDYLEVFGEVLPIDLQREDGARTQRCAPCGIPARPQV